MPSVTRLMSSGTRMALLLVGLGLPAGAAFGVTPAPVTLLVGPETEAQRAVVQAIEQALPPKAVALQVISVEAYRASGLDPGVVPPQLLVTVGAEAAAVTLKAQPPVPTLIALVPELTYRTLVRQHPARGKVPAVLYLDAPAARQLRLARAVLPRARRLGVVLGSESEWLDAPLRVAARAERFELVSEIVQSEDELLPAVYRLLDRSDALLALPDPLVVNRHTAQPLLLAAYRKRRPVIGYSRAFVRAGALAAAYSAPEHLGRDLAERILALLRPGTSLPRSPYPRHFAVEVNADVARALDLTPPDPAALAAGLRLQEPTGAGDTP